MPKNNGREVYPAGVVLGVCLDVSHKFFLGLGEHGEMKYFLVRNGHRARRALPLEGDFCTGLFCQAYDIKKPVRLEDLRVLYQSGVRYSSAEEVMPAVIGVRILYNFDNDFLEINHLFGKDEVIQRRAGEISDLLKELRLPSKPVKVYISGGRETILPDVKQR